MGNNREICFWKATVQLAELSLMIVEWGGASILFNCGLLGGTDPI